MNPATVQSPAVPRQHCGDCGSFRSVRYPPPGGVCLMTKKFRDSRWRPFDIGGGRIFISCFSARED
jgi:hypothetical protein